MRRYSRDPIAPRAETDEALWQALKADRAAGLGAIYDRYSSLVYGLARKILAHMHDAEDLTQEVFLALCKSDFDPALGPLAAYLVAMTRSRAIDKLRGRTRKAKFLEQFGNSVDTEPDAETVIDELSVAERSAHVRNALAQLPDDQRQVLEMTCYRGLTQAEIAAELGAPLGTVKSWARRGLFGLRRALEDVVQ